MEIAAGAAAQGLQLVTHLSCDTVEQMISTAKAAEALGYEAALALVSAVVPARRRRRTSSTSRKIIADAPISP